MDVNLVVFGGRLVRDPTLRYTPKGTAVCNMTLAASETRTSNGEKIKTTCFMDVVVWGKTGENVSKYLSKGFLCLVEGRLNQNKWETEDGQKRTKIEIYANKVIFGDNRGKEHGGGNQNAGDEHNEFDQEY